MTMKNYTSFSEWKNDQTTKNQKLITEVSKVIKNTAPHLDKVVKWGQGCWTEDKNHKIFIHCEPDYIQLGFYIGSQLKDPKNLLQGKGKYVRHIKIHSNKNIDKEAFKELIEQVL